MPSYPYIQLVEKLKRELAISNYKLGDIYQSSRQIVEKFDVAYLTARKAVDILIDEGILDRLPGCKPRIVRIPEMTKDLLSIDPSDYTIAIIADCSAMDNAARFANCVYRHTLSAIEARGFKQLTSLVMHSSEIGSLVERIIKSGFVNGIIVSCLYYESIARQIANAGFPAVFIDFAPKTAIVDSVNVNNQSAAQLAIKHLVELGHRRIDFIGHLRTDEIDDDAKELRDAWADLREPLGYIGQSHLVGNQPESPSSEDVVEDILASETRPTALFVSNPHIARNIKTLLETLSEPSAHPLSIVCVGGEFIESFPVSHVSQDWKELAKAAVNRIADRLNNDEPAGVRIHRVGEYCDRGSTYRILSSNEVKEIKS